MNGRYHQTLINRFCSRLIAIISLALFLPLASADVAHWQEFDIYYTTFSSTLIPSDVAAAHGIIRSKNRIVTNITIRRDGKAVTARLTGTSTNLFNQLFTLDFDEVKEPGAIYYLSNQLIDERDTLVFNIDISPANHDSSYHLKFTRQYY